GGGKALEGGARIGALGAVVADAQLPLLVGLSLNGLDRFGQERRIDLVDWHDQWDQGAIGRVAYGRIFRLVWLCPSPPRPRRGLAAATAGKVARGGVQRLAQDAASKADRLGDLPGRRAIRSIECGRQFVAFLVEVVVVLDELVDVVLLAADHVRQPSRFRE